MAKNVPSTETWRLNEVAVGPIIRAAHLGRKKTFKKGEFLYRQGTVDTEFFFILRGRIQIFTGREDGTEFVLEVMGQWAICGEGAAFDGQPRFSSAVAQEDTEVIVFDANEVGKAFQLAPDFALALLKITSMKQRVLGIRAQYLASANPESRISELLRRLAELYGRTQDGGVLIDIALTHDQIAAMTGTSRVTITRVLKKLRETSAIQTRGKQIWILDVSRLHL